MPHVHVEGSNVKIPILLSGIYIVNVTPNKIPTVLFLDILFYSRQN